MLAACSLAAVLFFSLLLSRVTCVRIMSLAVDMDLHLSSLGLSCLNICFANMYVLLVNT